jgi:hypothetical protein
MEVVEMAPAQISLEKVDGKQKQKVIKKPTKNEFSSPSNKNSKNHIFFEEEETCKSSSSPSHLTLEIAPSTSDNIGTRVQSKASTNVVVRAPSNPKVASKVANAKLVTVTTNDVSEVLPNPKVNGKVTHNQGEAQIRCQQRRGFLRANDFGSSQLPQTCEDRLESKCCCRNAK